MDNMLTSTAVRKILSWIAFAAALVLFARIAYSLLGAVEDWWIQSAAFLLIVALVVLALVSLVVNPAIGPGDAATPDSAPPVNGQSFPQGSTPFVLALEIALAVIFFYLSLTLLNKPADLIPWLENHPTGWFTPAFIINNQGALLMMFTAGLGSTLATTLGFVAHASSRGDFQSRYIPWYLIRPINGAILGLIFYWLIEGGLLAVLPPESQPESGQSLDLNALAAIGTLVGFLSREAISKLREIFEVMFATERSVPDGIQQQILSRKSQERTQSAYEHLLTRYADNPDAVLAVKRSWKKFGKN